MKLEWLSIGLLVACLPFSLAAQDEPASSPKATSSSAFSKVATHEVASYRFLQKDGSKADFRLRSAPLLR